jgi:hypothetical protein
MSITRVGSTKKFANGWDGVFTAKPGRKKGKGKKFAAKKPSAKTAAKKSSKKKPAKIVAPTAPGVLKQKSQPRPKVAKSGGPGDEKAKKSAAKRTSKTRTKRAAPELHQMELF